MVWIKVCVQEFPPMHTPRYLYPKAFVCIQEDVIYVYESDHSLSLDPDISNMKNNRYLTSPSKAKILYF